MKKTLQLLGGAALALVLAAPAQAQVLFWSTQAAPVEETQRMREQVLAGFEGGVDYQPQDDKGKAQGGPVHGGWDVVKRVKK